MDKSSLEAIMAPYLSGTSPPKATAIKFILFATSATMRNKLKMSASTTSMTPFLPPAMIEGKLSCGTPETASKIFITSKPKMVWLIPVNFHLSTGISFAQAVNKNLSKCGTSATHRNPFFKSKISMTKELINSSGPTMRDRSFGQLQATI